ncbi:MAG: PIG-L family deacetylase [Candidatus Omnitrophica bacterium]|nr:PIG-L family deacetylase [Candidatus Omnitrophota bacterium]
MKRKVLVVAVHPDDETLGCGGSILRFKKEKSKVYWLIATEMRGKHGCLVSSCRQRESEIENVAKMYGFDGVFRLGFPTTGVEAVPKNKLVTSMRNIFDRVRPDTLFLPYRSDIHSDHRAIFDAASSCTKWFRSSYLKRILMMETLSETEFAPSLPETAFAPNYYIDITDFLKKKTEIMKLYKSEAKKHPFPRSLRNIRALATFRGATAGCMFAESFILLKEIV